MIFIINIIVSFQLNPLKAILEVIKSATHGSVISSTLQLYFSNQDCSTEKISIEMFKITKH